VKNRTLVGAVVTFWTMSGIAGAGQARGMAPAASWERALSTGLASSWMWVPLTLIIVVVVRRAFFILSSPYCFIRAHS